MPKTPYPFAGRTLPNYIDGAFVGSETSFPVVDPVTGQAIGNVALADKAAVDAAVAAAKRALKGPWARMTLAARTAMLVAIADAIEARFDDFVAAEIADTGKSLLQATTIDIPRGAANFRSFAALAQARAMTSFQSDTPDGRGAINYSIARPLGVVAVVSPGTCPCCC